MDGLEISKKGDIGIICFNATSICSTEKINTASDEINSFIKESAPKNIVVDFEKVKFFSSQVLGLILSMRSQVKECSGQVVISSIDPQLYRVFKITNLDKIFKFYPDKESAVNELQSS